MGWVWFGFPEVGIVVLLLSANGWMDRSMETVRWWMRVGRVFPRFIVIITWERWKWKATY